jgi:hypothetical protein
VNHSRSDLRHSPSFLSPFTILPHPDARHRRKRGPRVSSNGVCHTLPPVTEAKGLVGCPQMALTEANGINGCPQTAAMGGGPRTAFPTRYPVPVCWRSLGVLETALERHRTAAPGHLRNPSGCPQTKGIFEGTAFGCPRSTHLGVHDPHSCGVQEPSIHRWVPTNHPPSTGGCPRTATSTNHHRRQRGRLSRSIHTWVSVHEPGGCPRTNEPGGCPRTKGRGVCCRGLLPMHGRLSGAS